MGQENLKKSGIKLHLFKALICQVLTGKVGNSQESPQLKQAISLVRVRVLL